MRRAAWILALTAAATLITMPATRSAEKPVLKVGAASVKITPSLTRPVYIAGYANNRIAESVHDDLWARALVLDDGRTRAAVVVCDLIGLSNYRVREIRKAIRAVPADHVLIATTHVHSGPDTLGLWGANNFTSGIDPLYQSRLADRIAAVVEAAAQDARPVQMSAGTTKVPDGLVHNKREPVQDKTLTTLRFTDGTGQTVASVVHYGGHPEVNTGKAITSDFVHYVREQVEQKHGGVCLFLNGALGGMVTPQVKGNTLAEMERVGLGVGKAALKALEKSENVEADRLRLERKIVSMPLENLQFRVAAGAKVLDAGPLTAPELLTEVWRLDVGPVSAVTIPGEILPKPALQLKEMIRARYPIVLAMANDELGYILDPTDFDRDKYKYEKSMSVGAKTWPLLLETARELLAK